ncbi:MAG: hypothetical protein Q9162_004806 [Coniocarpon cinnabarinum]
MASQQRQLHHLRFKQPVTWKAGRQIPLNELLKRLTALSQELQEVEQEEFAKETLSATAKELVSPQLLAHKDRGVRAYAAHCLVDVLRLFAPDAPYTPAELKEIYSLFINTIIHSLSDANHPYNSQHLYIINSLAEVKSIVLLADVPGATPLITQLFRECFDILATSGHDIGRHVEYNLSSILNCMVEESEMLPPEAVDMILAQFLHADPNVRNTSTKGKKVVALLSASDGQHKIPKPLPPSYGVAKNLCNSCVKQMARYISQYFGNVIIDASNLNAHNDEDDGTGSVSDEDMKQLRRAHRLLRELWRACPGVLQNVIPQIEAELSAENEQIRMLSTQAVGDLVAGIGAGGDVSPPSFNPCSYPLPATSIQDESRASGSIPHSFSQTHSTTFQLFLGRRNDKSHYIRGAWAQCVGRILATSAGEIGLERHTEETLVSSLSHMMNDSDERVRVAAVQAVELLSVSQIGRTMGPQGGVDTDGSLLHNLAERARDKKATVRSAAIMFLARAWASALADIVSGDEKIKELLGSAPSKVLNAYYINDRETNHVITQAVFEYLCPLGYPALKSKDKAPVNGDVHAHDGADAVFDADAIRTERILYLLDSLDSKARFVFFALIKQPHRLHPYLKLLLQRFEEYSGGVAKDGKNMKDVKDHLGKLIAYFAKKMPNIERAEQDLWKFAKDHDRRSYALIRFCMAHDSDYRKIHRSIKELERKMNGFPPQNAPTFETVRDVVLMSANLISNKSHVRPVIAFAQNSEHGLGAAAHELLKEISTETPDIFKSHSTELCKSLVDSAPEDADVEQSSLLDSLKACASFARKFPGELPKDRKFIQAMSQYALHGSPPVAAKHAVTIIMFSTDSKQMHAKNLAKSCLDDFQYGSSHFLTRLACLSQLMLLAAEDLEDESDSITEIAINHVLKSSQNSLTSDDKKDWTDSPDQDLQAKIWALKIIVNRLRHYNDPESVSPIAPSTYKLLNQLIAARGDLLKSSESPTPPHHRSRLHLQAAVSLLKLSSKRGFDALLAPSDFHNLCLTAQAEIPQLRIPFITKIRKLLGQDRLPSRFHIPVFLLAFEPRDDLREESATWLRARANTQRIAQERAAPSHNGTRRSSHVLEACLSRFISLLAHHPDFQTISSSDLVDMSRYFTFYLSCIATPQNLGLIFHVAQRVKSVADNLAETWEDDLDPSQRLYILSDLAQAVIRRWEEIKGWRLEAPTGRVSMPAGIFKTLPNSTTAREIATRNFLPSDVEEGIEGVVKEALGKGKKRKSDEGEKQAKKRAPPTKTKAVSRAPKRAKTPEEDEEEQGSDESAREWGSSKKRKREGKEKDETGSERRKSSRAGGRKSYKEDESEDEAEMMEWEDSSGGGVKLDEREIEQVDDAAESEGGDAEEEGESRDEQEDEQVDEKQDEKRDEKQSDADEELSDVPDNLSEHDMDIGEANNQEGKEEEEISAPESTVNAKTKGRKGKTKAAPKPSPKIGTRAAPKQAPRAGTRSSARRAKR